jgi:hypothetical protein
MGALSKELRDLGYERTERESPFDESGELWTNSYELVCDATGFVIRKDTSRSKEERVSEEKVYTYRNSEKVKLYGGYVSSYDWGETEESGFTYDRK